MSPGPETRSKVKEKFTQTANEPKMSFSEKDLSGHTAPINANQSLIFNGKDYEQWKQRMKVKLRARDLEDTLKKEAASGNKEHQKSEVIALDLLLNFIDNNTLRSLGAVNSPYVLFKKLDEKYNAKNVNEIVSLRTELASLKFNGNNVDSHLNDIEKLYRDLENQNEETSEGEKITWLLTSLPPSYSNVRTSANALAETGNLTFKALKNILRAEEKQRKLQRLNFPRPQPNVNVDRTPKPSALNVQKRPDKNGNTSTSVPNSTLRCFRCNENGHIGRKCPKFGDDTPNPKRPSKTASESTKQTSTELKAMLTHVTFVTKCDVQPNCIEFIVDSGASDHMTNKLCGIFDYKPFESPLKVNCAKKNAIIEAYGSGQIIIFANDGKRKLSDVYYVPELSMPLLPVSKLMERGYGVSFCKDTTVISEVASNEIIISTKITERNLPSVIFEYERVAEPAVTLVTSAEQHDNAKLWHRRLGHIPAQYLKKLANDVQSEIPTLRPDHIKLETCDICCEAKQRRESCGETRQRATRPLQLVHTDIIGPLIPSVYGERYVITFIDDYTHYSVTQVLTNRSEAAEKFQSYAKFATAKFNTKISTVRCDNAREIVMGQFKSFCDEEGITLQISEPYLHEHNGTAERWNRLLMERTRALLYEAKMPVDMWTFAVYAATYLLNRSPTTTINWKTPFEMWNGKKPTLKHIRIFGCFAHALVPYERRTKLEPKSVHLILVGYYDTGYILFDPEKKKSVTHSHVICDENRNWGNLNNTPPQQIDIERLIVEEEEEIFVIGDENDPDIHAFSTETEHELTYNEAVNGPDKEMWLQAINEELNAIYANETWSPVQRSVGEKGLTTTWVFRIKDENGKKRYKARLCVRGFQEKIQFDIADTYAPVAKFCTVRAIITLAKRKDWPLEQIDVGNAFLNGIVKHRTIIEVPKGITKYNPNTVLLLNKSLYGLRTSPKDWNDKLNETLKELGMKPTQTDPCVYVCEENPLDYILVNHVDDMIITGKNKRKIRALIDRLKTKFKLKDLGRPEKYLGINIVYDTSSIKLNQTSYIKDVLHEFGLSDCNGVNTPLDPNLRIVNPQPDGKSEHLYRKLIGCLQYIAQCTRPDIAYPVNLLSRYQNQANTELVQYAKRILRYLKTTMNTELVITGALNSPIEIFCDSDFAGDPQDRKSTTGIIVKMYGDTINWITRKQSSVAISSAEAEYLALSQAATEARGWRNLFRELGAFKPENSPILINCDSTAALAIASTAESRRTRHIDVSFHNVREGVKNKEFTLKKIASVDQPADLLTKSFARERLTYLKNLIGLLEH